MAYHINPKTGNPGICRAEKNCPFGDSNHHYPTKEEASAAFEAAQDSFPLAGNLPRDLSELQLIGLINDTLNSKKQMKTKASTIAAAGLHPNATTMVLYSGRRAIYDMEEPQRDRARQLYYDGKIKRSQIDEHIAPELIEAGRIFTRELEKLERAHRKKTAKVRVPSVAQFQKEIAVPSGFTAKAGKTSWGHGLNHFEVDNLILEGDGITITIDLGRDNYSLGTGHVSFSTSQGTRTFDRRGVEDSFYIGNPQNYGINDELLDPVEAANKTIKRFIEEKIPASRAKIDQSETLPGTSLLIDDEKRARLAADGKLTLTPSGFGTGYVFSKTKTRWGREATNAQKKALGVAGSLYVETFDAD